MLSKTIIILSYKYLTTDTRYNIVRDKVDS